ncbi:MAG: ABC transporter permease [Planctomycetota bacterium]|nr:ABC transporter permease [Planctomycetota bacterium]
MSRGRPGAASILGAALRVARKELVEGFRDRQTLIYTFVLPVCMYPALGWIMIQGLLILQGQKSARDVTVGLVAPAEVAEEATRAIAAEPEEGDGGGRVEVQQLALTPDSDTAALRSALEGFDAIVALPGLPGGPGPVRVLFDSTRSRSGTARERIEASLGQWADELRGQAAEERAIDPRALDPFDVSSESVAEESDQANVVLSLILPLLLVVMSVLGAFFPAVDLTAGEKERRCAETTMLLPVPMTAVHLGKIFAVCASAMIATALNLAAIALSAGHLIDQLSAAADRSIALELPVGALLTVLPLAVLFAFFVSAALTGFASLASSFKEGQALLGPVQMLFILPAMTAQLPGLTLDCTTAVIPVVNVALAFRGLLVGDVQALPLALCAGVLLLLALASIWLSVRLRSNEKVALSGETLSLGSLVGLLPSK